MNTIEVEKSLQKQCKLHDRGLLTRVECAESFLLHVAGNGLALEAERLLNLLPQEIATQVRNRLIELETTDYDWSPFLIGTGVTAAELEQQREQLRVMHHCVCQQS